VAAYAHDGFVLLSLFFTRFLPLAILNRWNRLKSQRQPRELLINAEVQHDRETIRLSGDAIERNIGKAVSYFRETLTEQNLDLVIDLARVRVMDARFFGLILMLRKSLKGRRKKLAFVGVSPAMRRLFRLNEIDFLLYNRA
jgi:N-acetylglucosaminyldiphosphoundecaprenol N-acetyl-beta-D-mannosaminyltransferase